MEYKPIARSSDVVVQEVGEETLVYDLKTHQAKCLNETAGTIWKMCDGTKTVTDLTIALSAEFKTKVDQELVVLALDQLQKEDLVESDDFAFGLKGTSRRDVIKKVGFAAVVALPVVSAVVAPRAANAASVILCSDVTIFDCDCSLSANPGGQGTPACVSAFAAAGWKSTRAGNVGGICDTNDVSCVSNPGVCGPNHVGKCCSILEAKACGPDPLVSQPCCAI